MSSRPFVYRYMDQPQNDFGGVQKYFTRELSYPLREHLSRVYKTLTLLVLNATFFGAIAVAYNINSFIFGVLHLIALVAFGFSSRASTLLNGIPAQPVYLGVISATAGLMLQPVCRYAHYLNPSLLLSAMLLTTIIFGCFTYFSTKVERSTMLYLYAPLSSFIMGFSTLMLVSYLFGFSILPYSLTLGITSIIMCAYIALDTQLILQRYEEFGDSNHHEHALILFMDFVQLFVRVLRLLMELQDNERKNQQRRRRND